MKVTLLDRMGDDLTPVNRARLSFDKQSDWAGGPIHSYDGNQNQLYQINNYTLSEKDVKLTNYLAREKHVLPFRHPQIALHIKAPIFVIRQLDKHQVGFSTSEISRRYVSDKPEFYIPDMWREAAKDKKQGSGENFTNLIKDQNMKDLYHSITFNCLATYKCMLENGVAPEMARMVLPASLYTEQAKTGSLLGWFHLWKLRSSSDAQWEVQQIAKQVEEIIQPLFPVSWEALKNGKV